MSEPVRESMVDWQKRSAASIKAGLCACLQCIQDRGEMSVRMSLCPKASNHRFECTGSNEVGQPGSFYGPRPATPENG